MVTPSPTPTPYPDPSHSDSPRRFYVGYNHNGAFVVGSYVYWNWSPIWDGQGAPGYNGICAVVDTSDPYNAYIELTADSPDPLPDWRVGDTIFNDNPVNRWATIVPWVPAERALWLYPASPTPDDKIYYANVTPGSLLIGDELWLIYDLTGYCIITELGSDADGTWFKCRAATELWAPATLIQWTAGNIGTADGIQGERQFDVMPHPATTSFDETRDELVGQARLSIYLSEEIDAFDVFSLINAAVASYLFNDHLGKYRYVAYMPPAGAALPQFTEDDIFSFSEDVDASGIISRVKAKYQHRVTQDYWQVRFVERPEAQYLQRSPVAILKEVEFPFVRASDGLKGGQRTALMEGVPQRVYKAKVSSKAWTLLPSDFIQVTYSRHGINGIFEVIETKRDLKTGQVDLVVGGLRGITGGGLSGGFGYPGHWTEEAPAFPASLGGGSAAAWDPAWTAEQKAHAKQNFGYWCDEDGFADPTDPESFLASTWI